MHDQLATLYPRHLAALRDRADKALALGGFDHLLIAAGMPTEKFLDDLHYTLADKPHFKKWLTMT
jgi:Xaa-Pro dipeptidase